MIANSGNANAATGAAGHGRRARRCSARRPPALGVEPATVGVASTGVIGVPLPTAGLQAGIAAAAAALHADGDEAFSEAIMTTDALPQARDARRRRCPSGTVRLSAQAKGAGMIEPAFATMLCFVQTDAALAPETAELLLGVCVKRSFDRISVDGQLSTNDTVILMCSGASGVTRRARERGRAALRRGARRAAADARDHDRARRRGRQADRPRRRARRRRRRSSSAARGRSPTRRSSRPRCTAPTRTGAGSRRRSARALPGTAPLALDIAIEGITSARGGVAVAHDADALQAAAAGLEIEYEVGLPGDPGAGDRGAVLRPQPRVRDHQRGVHDMRTT